MNDYIKIIGAKENNLKNINVEIPRNKLVVFTGVSGSGKSTLAFDTIFAEGQRRYLESLSSYARLFLGQMQKPDVEKIEGLSPTIAIDQKTTSNNPRSTVGTVTEIYDYLRLLFCHIGEPHCPNCGKKVSAQTIDQITDQILQWEVGTKIIIKAPVIKGQKGSFENLIAQLKSNGYARVEIDGVIQSLDDVITLEKTKKHDISVVVDRIILKEGIKKRLTDSLELALSIADGTTILEKDGENILFSTKFACEDCNISMLNLEPKLFSFNNPYGACPECDGLGIKLSVAKEKVIKDENKSIMEGAVGASGWNMEFAKISQAYFRGLAEKYNFDLNAPFNKLPKKIQNYILYGTNGESINIKLSFGGRTQEYTKPYEGIIPNLERRFKESTSEYAKAEIRKYMHETPCPVCNGKRLNKYALSVFIDGKNIEETTSLSVVNIYQFISNLKLSKHKQVIAKPIVDEICNRLKFLIDVGLGYLTLSRSSGTLSGGESQRIRLASQIGSGLTGVLYILDEPSIGLHQRDNDKLLNTLKTLRDLGNTLIVVEHDEDTIKSADFIVDIGPYAGMKGGELVYAGDYKGLLKCDISETANYLSYKKVINIPKQRRKISDKKLKIYGLKQNNLKNIDVEIPLGVLNVITGVSGSGKSSFITETLYPILANKLNHAQLNEGIYREIEGVSNCDKVIMIDQDPIGRTPRSNPATYTGVFTNIRELFASTPDAKERGYTPSRFSFNVSGGRCEACQGDGIKKIEMYFMPDVYVPCEICHGKRYNSETLEVKYKGKSIYDVLEMSIDEAILFFENLPQIKNKLQAISDVGLGYIKLGQSATTLSGGEAQRVKLSSELSKRATGNTVYILDEPTTGLSKYDVHKLINILQRLVDNGNTVIIIEHNLDVIKIADYVIDIGPEGGEDGGKVVASGTPEDIALNKNSWTGKYLKPLLQNEKEY